MLIDRFDAYGEILPKVSEGKDEAARTASAVLGRIGQYAFWALVTVIIAARIIYYPATPNFEVGSASDPKQIIAR
jgi:hypothetical protein